MNKTLNLLELFKGTGSISKVACNHFNIISLDFEKKFNPDINIDILEWDYKKYYIETGFIPDFIWASPPCNTFSTLSCPLRERDTQTAKPISTRAKIGTKILYKTLEIISFFKRKNKNLLFVIENPVGMMRKDIKMQKLQFMTTTYYSLYNDNRYKPTNFWSNFELILRKGNPKKCFNQNKEKVRVARDIKLTERYKIPEMLVNDIINQILININNNIHHYHDLSISQLNVLD